MTTAQNSGRTAARIRRAAAAALALLVLPLGPATTVAEPNSDLARWVNPFIGTQPGDADMGTGGGAANTFPGAVTPFGMVQWSPDTVTRQHGGYYYDDNRIRGFSLTHLSGAGCSTYEDIPFLPVVGGVTTSPAVDPARYISTFSHTREHASPGRYQVNLDNGAAVELTATQRAGVGRFSYPAGAPATLLVYPSGSVTGTDDAQVHIGRDVIEGYAVSGKFCDQQLRPYKVFFHAQFDRPFAERGVWKMGDVTRSGTTASGPGIGGYVRFDTGRSTDVGVRVGLSFVSVDGAKANLAEVRGRSVAQVAAAARATWNARLSQIQVTGGGDDRRTIFYTALYHALIQPNVFSDVDGRYVGFDGRPHATDPDHPIYTNFSGWDIYRSEAQLLALLAPREAADIAATMVIFAQQGGNWDRWTVANAYTGVMNGDPYHIIVSSMYAFGANGFDAGLALALMAESATAPRAGRDGYEERPGLADYLRLGYVPGKPADTLEYTSADFAIAQLADRLGAAPIREEFLRRARTWRTLHNPATNHLQPRSADGSFAPGFDPASPDGYVEGNGAQYTWMVPYDLRGLIAALGGPQAALARLDAFFTVLNAGTRKPYAFLGNEPTLQTPWIYSYAGAPAKTQATVNRVRQELWKPGPNGLVGNDDLGEMSAWYVWAALGMYPEIPGRAELLLNGPEFTETVVTRPNGVRITVRAPGAAAARPYVAALHVDGKPWPRAWLPESFVATGGVLDFAMSATPTPWGSSPIDAPPSFG